jgi:hypothetical protein
MRTHATSHMWETSLQNCQILENLLGNIKIFLLLKSDFPHTKFNFLQWLSTFFNGFPLSSMTFQFSSMAFQFSSMAFLFPRNLRKSIYGGKYTKDHHSSFVFPATRSPSFVIATRSPSFVITTRTPSFVIATMPTSHPTCMIVDSYKARKRYTVTESLFICTRRKFGFNKKIHTKLALRPQQKNSDTTTQLYCTLST